MDEESPRSQLSRFFYNNRDQSRKHAPSVNSIMQKSKQLKHIVSLWQQIVTSVTQLHRKAQAEQHGDVLARIIKDSNLILFRFFFLVDKTRPVHLNLFKPTSLAVLVRHRTSKKLFTYLRPAEETDFLPYYLFSDGSGHLHCSLPSTDGKDAVFSLKTLMTSSKHNTIIPTILFCLL